MRSRSLLLRCAVPLAAGVAVFGMTAGPASATDVPVHFACRANPPIGGAQTFAMDGSADATGPSGSSFSVSLATDPITVPASVGGNTVNSLSNLKLSIPVPPAAAATLTAESLSGGSGVPGVTVAVTGGKIVTTVPGPIAGAARSSSRSST